MSKPNVPQFIKDASRMVEKHSPEILMGIGIAGMITTTILAVKATPKALKLIDEKKKEEHKDELTPMETVKTTWKCYIPAAVSGMTSIACIVGAGSVNAKRNAALATAYKLSETALTEYRDAVVETIGEKKAELVKDKVAEDKVKKNPVSASEVIVTERGNTLCLDGTFGRYFLSDIDKIKKAENELNRRLINEMYVSLNEFYDELDIPHIEIGDRLGWNLDDGKIELETKAKIADDGRPCIVIEYSIAPRYDYYKLS